MAVDLGEQPQARPVELKVDAVQLLAIDHHGETVVAADALLLRRDHLADTEDAILLHACPQRHALEPLSAGGLQTRVGCRRDRSR